MIGRTNASNPIAGEIQLEVVTSEAEIPATADNGTVVVITTVDVNDVYARNVMPATPYEGDLCIWTGVSSQAPIEFTEFIDLYPRGVYQYAGGSWTLRVAYIRYEDTWVPMTLYLYDAGAEMLATFELTDTWNCYLVKQEAALYVRVDGGATAGVSTRLKATPMIDLTGVSQIKIHYTASYGSTGPLGVIGSAKLYISVQSDQTELSSVNMPASSVGSVTTLDVSSRTGLHYIGVYTGLGSGQGYDAGENRIYITRIELVKE